MGGCIVYVCVLFFKLNCLLQTPVTKFHEDCDWREENDFLETHNPTFVRKSNSSVNIHSGERTWLSKHGSLSLSCSFLQRYSSSIGRALNPLHTGKNMGVYLYKFFFLYLRLSNLCRKTAFIFIYNFSFSSFIPETEEEKERRTVTWHSLFPMCQLYFNHLNTKLNPICPLLALLGAHHILHVSR